MKLVVLDSIEDLIYLFILLVNIVNLGDENDKFVDRALPISFHRTK